MHKFNLFAVQIRKRICHVIFIGKMSASAIFILDLKGKVRQNIVQRIVCADHGQCMLLGYIRVHFMTDSPRQQVEGRNGMSAAV